MTRSEFLAAVEKAAERARKRHRRPRFIAKASLDNLARARMADPMMGVRAARLAPRCGKVKRSDGRPCLSPCVRGGTKCWKHGGLRQAPSHRGNIRRYLDGTFGRQEAYKMELRTMGEFWFQLSIDQQRELQRMLAPKAYSDPRILDWGARAYLARTEDHFMSWMHFMKSMRARRLWASQ